MKTLHLDNNFTPNGSSINYDKFTFPGGETHIRIKDYLDGDVLITQVIHNGNDIMEIALAVDALERMGIQNIDLFIPYVPYARQDRVMSSGESLSIKVFTNIINSLGLKNVYIFDPHSDVTAALINNCKVINNHDFIWWVVNQLFPDNQKFCLVCPDAGADKKIKDLAKYISKFHDDFEIIKCDKTRDVKTGNIDGFKVYSDKINIDCPCLIVDDLCDGGGTFIGLGNMLLNFNPPQLYLAVSHGIFSKGVFPLTDHLFDQIFTTNSFYNQTYKEILTYKIQLGE